MPQRRQMTTPGHQAGPTPADGGPAPGTGFPPREGVPEAGDARYGFPEAQDTRYGIPEARDTRYGVPEGQDARYRVPEAQDARYGYRGEVSAGRTEARGRARPRHAADRGHQPGPRPRRRARGVPACCAPAASWRWAPSPPGSPGSCARPS